MDRQPARLYKSEQDFLEQELRISVKTLLSLLILAAAFIIFCYLSKGQTYGYL